MSIRKFPERKERDEDNLWIYDEDMNNIIKSLQGLRVIVSII